MFNTQPWQWRVAGDILELSSEPKRQLGATDPDGRLLISCGAALHHARTALAATGYAVTVDRMPDPAHPELLARIHLGAVVPPDREAQRMAAAIARRRTDRSPSWMLPGICALTWLGTPPGVENCRTRAVSPSSPCEICG